ncbi:hypothetical protein KF728_29560 [Candidatus Obscuribacterales bacterium]|nr:hypothetical protein [Candidatus Obscuribacterales bacterium]MBX3154336.1 hypothetical protein [Candidatus Obscuribacterales bacterium]
MNRKLVRRVYASLIFSSIVAGCIFGCSDWLTLARDRIQYDLFDAARNPYNFEDEHFVVVARRKIPIGQTVSDEDVFLVQLPKSFEISNDALWHKGLAVGKKAAETLEEGTMIASKQLFPNRPDYRRPSPRGEHRHLGEFLTF